MSCSAIRKHVFKKSIKLTTIATILLSVTYANAHEYWLAPVEKQWQVGQVFKADIRNGEDFIGTAYPFDNAALRFGGLISDTARRPLRGRLGDYPAISYKLEEPGLHLSILETTAREITYEKSDKFQNFLHYHDLNSIANALPDMPSGQNKIRERYFRFVKALFVVAPANSTSPETSLINAMQKDSTAAALEAQGQRLELVAGSVSDDTNDINVTLLLDGKALANRQVEIFHQADSKSEATRKLALSDAKGTVTFNIAAKGDYLINSVWISRPQINDVDWETLWASMTFSH